MDTAKRFEAARAELEHYTDQYRQARNVDSLIAAAQYWGIMCGLAAAEKEAGRPGLQTILDGLTPTLYPSEFDAEDAQPF